MKEIVAVYDDEEVLLDAIETVKKQNVKIDNVYTPFPVHGLEEAIGLQRSRIPTVGFIGGSVGLMTALSLQIFTMTIDWPNNIGGKPILPLPSFIPVSFELTVLFSAFSMVISYFIINNLKPSPKPPFVYDERQTSDRFVLVMHPTAGVGAEAIRAAVAGTRALDVREVEPPVVEAH
jgi:hypothetical protein